MKPPSRNPHLLQVPLYVAGKSTREATEGAGVRGAVKLASNENPLGPSPMAVKALREAAAKAHRYPGGAERDLIERLAEFHGGGLTEANFLVGNGASDLLRLVAQAFLFDGGSASMSGVTFPLFKIMTTMFGAQPVERGPLPNWQLDLAGMARDADEDCRIVWLCSPNNPTGLTLSDRDVRSFIADLSEHVLVVLDESYADFVSDSSAVNGLGLVRSGLNVIAVRSFSKCAGLANLRVGYAVASPDTIEYVKRARPPFNTGGPALIAARASLEDSEHWRRSKELIREERDYLERSLREIELRPLSSQASFVLLPEVPGGGKQFADRLLQSGFIVRPMGGFGVPEGVRVSVGTHAQNERFVAAVQRLLSESMTLEGPTSP